MLEETSLHFHTWATFLVPWGRKPAPGGAGRLQAGAGSSRPRRLRSGCGQTGPSVRWAACGGKQIAEKCTARHFGLNVSNGIRSVIIEINFTSLAAGQAAVALLLLQMNVHLLGKKRHINDVSLRFGSR